MSTKKLAVKKSTVTVNDGDTKDDKKYIIVDPESQSCSKMLTGKAATSREGRRWVDDSYSNSVTFVAEIIGRLQKRGLAADNIPVIEV